MSFDFDLFVIGCGSGGMRASRLASQNGLKVAVAEEDKIGGTCINIGCIPKKLFTYASGYSSEFEKAKKYGWRFNDLGFDWPTLIKTKDDETERLQAVYQKTLETNGVTIIKGRATFINSNTLSINGKIYTAKHILITVGATPTIPEIKGKEFIKTSFDAFYLKKLPKEVIVIGSGYIALEFAGIFNGLGVKTTVLVRGNKILAGLDKDITETLSKQMTEKGVNIIYNTEVAELHEANGVSTVITNNGEKMSAEFVMFAIGRRPFVDGLGLENTKVKLENGAIVVNENFQTADESIFALGDVINKMQLTPVALGEANVFVRNNYLGKSDKFLYENIPTAIFSDPEVGTVGLSEQDAIKKGYDVKIFMSKFRPLKTVASGGTYQTMMKLIVDRKTDVVLGAHMVGPYSAEIIQGIGICVKAKLTKDDFDQTVGIHPSAAEEFVTMSKPIN